MANRKQKLNFWAEEEDEVDPHEDDPQNDTSPQLPGGEEEGSDSDGPPALQIDEDIADPPAQEAEGVDPAVVRNFQGIKINPPQPSQPDLGI